MASVQHVMSHDHKRCDDLFARVENHVAENNWEEAEQIFKSFCNAMNGHFEQEENILFPAFEERTGSQGGPTMMMRHEHGEMRSLIAEMQKSVSEKNKNRYLGLSETLLIFMQQHNMKEEQILYPMIDNTCADQTDTFFENFNTNSDAA